MLRARFVILLLALIVPVAARAEEAPNKKDAGGESNERQFCVEAAVEPEEGWPEITVLSVFDATRSGIYVAIIRMDGRRIFVQEGELLRKYKILRIDGEKECVTIIRCDRQNESAPSREGQLSQAPEESEIKKPTEGAKHETRANQREYCKDAERREADDGWPDIIVKSIFDPAKSGNYIAIIEINTRKRFVRQGEQFGDYRVQRIDGECGCLTIVRRKSTNVPEIESEPDREPDIEEPIVIDVSDD